ncbi:MAG: XRE family transcriptional regulator [Bacillota bacterium]|nr:XRE family transcriptional regulator [Bacillota bacterium]
MSTFANRFKTLRALRKLTQDELARELEISKSAISMYENGNREPDFETLELIADFFNVDMNYLLGHDVPAHTPLYEAAAGPGRINDGYTDTISLQLGADEVAVAVKGDSMYPVLCDGDIAIVAATSVVSSEDDIMLVKINGDEATLKYVKKDSGGLYLYAENTDVFKRKFFTAEEVEEFPVTIEGVVVRFVREMK